MSPASRPHKHLVLAHDFWLAQVLCLLEMQVAYSEERPLAVGVSARKHRFIGQPALPPERDLFSRRLSVPAFRTICLFTLQATHTHTHTHTHSHTLLCTGWVWNASRREKPLTKMSASWQRLKEHTTKNHHDYCMDLSLPGRKRASHLPEPHCSLCPHDGIVMYSPKDLIKIIQDKSKTKFQGHRSTVKSWNTQKLPLLKQH